MKTFLITVFTVLMAVSAPAAVVTEQWGDATGTDHQGTCKDTWLHDHAPHDLDQIEYMHTYTFPDYTISNIILIKWDLSAIPTGTTVTAATLEISVHEVNSLAYLIANNALTYTNTIHRIINFDPVIEDVSWFEYDVANAHSWTSDGAQDDIAPYEDKVSIPTNVGIYHKFKCTEMVRLWVNNPALNYGMAVNSDPLAIYDNMRSYNSTEAANSDLRPRLIITYGDAVPDTTVPAAPDMGSLEISGTNVILTWTASVSNDTVGYRIYRGTESGSLTMLTNIGQVTTFTDSGLIPGTTYYYTVTAVDGSGNESADSQELSVYVADEGMASGTSLTVLQNTITEEGDARIYLPLTESLGNVVVDVYDLRGAKITELANGSYPAVGRVITWDGGVEESSAPSGMYLLRVNGAGFDEVVKVFLVK